MTATIAPTTSSHPTVESAAHRPAARDHLNALFTEFRVPLYRDEAGEWHRAHLHGRAEAGPKIPGPTASTLVPVLPALEALAEARAQSTPIGTSTNPIGATSPVRTGDKAVLSEGTETHQVHLLASRPTGVLVWGIGMDEPREVPAQNLRTPAGEAIALTGPTSHDDGPTRIRTPDGTKVDYTRPALGSQLIRSSDGRTGTVTSHDVQSCWGNPEPGVRVDWSDNKTTSFDLQSEWMLAEAVRDGRIQVVDPTDPSAATAPATPPAPETVGPAAATPLSSLVDAATTAAARLPAPEHPASTDTHGKILQKDRSSILGRLHAIRSLVPEDREPGLEALRTATIMGDTAAHTARTWSIEERRPIQDLADRLTAEFTARAGSASTPAPVTVDSSAPAATATAEPATAASSTPDPDAPGAKRWWNGDEVEIIGPSASEAGFVQARRLGDGKVLTIASRATEAKRVEEAKESWQREQAAFRNLHAATTAPAAGPDSPPSSPVATSIPSVGVDVPAQVHADIAAFTADMPAQGADRARAALHQVITVHDPALAETPGSLTGPRAVVVSRLVAAGYTHEVDQGGRLVRAPTGDHGPSTQGMQELAGVGVQFGRFLLDRRQAAVTAGSPSPSSDQAASRPDTSSPDPERQSTATPDVQTAAAPAATEVASITQSPWSYEGHSALARKARCLELTPDDYRAAFEWTVANKATIKEHLGAKTLKELAPRGAGGLKKGQVVDHIYSKIVDRFVPVSVTVEGLTSLTGKWDQALEASQRKALAGLTPKTIEDLRAQSAEYQEKMRRCQEDPRSLDEYRTFVRLKGQTALSDEQLARWDQQESDLARVARRERRARDAKISAVDVGGVTATITQTKHTQKGHDLWVVQLEERVDKERYTQLNDAAKKMGGYYSSFRGNGAIPGFQFKEASLAEKFVALTKGQAVDISEERDERRIERMGNAVERMRALADHREQRAVEEETKDRLNNTARRASMAASAVKEARKAAARAGTLRNIANGIDAGEVEYLDQIRSLADVDTLERELHRAHWARARAAGEAASSYNAQEKAMEEPYDATTIRHLDHPSLTLSIEQARRLAGGMLKTDGLKRAGAALEKRAAAAASGADPAAADPRLEISASDPLFSDLAKVDDPWLPAMIAETKRLERMGATNIHCLRQIAREYLPYRAEARKDSPLAVAERALIGRKFPGFFPTPKTLVRDLILEADVGKGMKVLEPEAGKGDIADAARDMGASVDCIEPVHDLREILTLKGHNLVAHDFMAYQSGGYDRIIMNPPFEDGQDIDHVRHAYDLLAPRGRLSAIMSSGPFTRSDKQAEAFRSWLNQVGGTQRPNPEGSFAGADAFRRTMVATHLVTITKP